MKTYCEKVKDFLYGKESGRWILSALLIVVLYGVLFQFSVIRYSTNDDNTIVNSIIYAAEQPETAPVGFMYINYFLGVFLAFFYRNFGNVPWYDLYSVGVLLLSGVIIFKNILKEGYKSHKSFWGLIFLIFILFFALLAAIFQQVQFTTTAAAAGTAALVSFLCLDEKGKSRIADLLIAWIFFHACMFQRQMVGYVILAFFILLLVVDVVRCLCRYKNLCQVKFKILFSILLFASIWLTGASSEQLNSGYNESEEFEEYSDLRVRYMDYNVDAYLTYPEIYEEAGWDENLCVMVKNWYFMDKRYNVDTLREILEVVDRPENREEDVVSWSDAGKIWKYLLESERRAQLELCFALVLFALGMIQFLRNREEANIWRALVIAGSWAGSALMYLYLCFSGRLPLRVFEAIMLPAAVLTIISIIQMTEKPSVQRKRCGMKGVKIGTMVIFLAITAGIAGELFDREAQERYQEERNRLISMKEFCAENDENVYIYDNTLTGGEPIFYRSKNNTVYNCFFWGGTSMFSQSYYANLEKNGLQELHSEDWFRDNVYYLTQNQEMIYVLYNYLDGIFENVSFELQETIGNILVAKFTNEG